MDAVRAFEILHKLWVEKDKELAEATRARVLRQVPQETVEQLADEVDALAVALNEVRSKP